MRLRCLQPCNQSVSSSKAILRDEAEHNFQIADGLVFLVASTEHSLECAVKSAERQDRSSNCWSLALVSWKLADLACSLVQGSFERCSVREIDLRAFRGVVSADLNGLHGSWLRRDALALGHQGSFCKIHTRTLLA